MGVASCIAAAIDACYVRPFDRIFSRRVFRYGACGGANMALDTVWYYLIYHYVVRMRMVHIGGLTISSYIATLALVFPITFFIGFWLNRNVAFTGSVLRTRTQLLRYALTVAGAVLLNYLCMKLLVEGLQIWATPAKSVTTLVSAVYSYLVARYFTFKV